MQIVAPYPRVTSKAISWMKIALRDQSWFVECTELGHRDGCHIYSRASYVISITVLAERGVSNIYFYHPPPWPIQSTRCPSRITGGRNARRPIVMQKRRWLPESHPETKAIDPARSADSRRLSIPHTAVLYGWERTGPVLMMPFLWPYGPSTSNHLWISAMVGSSTHRSGMGRSAKILTLILLANTPMSLRNHTEWFS